MDKETLVQDVADLASSYLGEGARIPNVKSDTPSGQIHNIEDLLIRYFIVTGIDRLEERVEPAREQVEPEVIPFINKLPGRIKRLQTTTEPTLELTRGNIRGHVDWQETIKTRSRRGSNDRSLFVCRQNDDYVDTPENRVLATLLARIHGVIREELKSAQEKPDSYEWLDPWIRPEGQLRKTVQELRFNNQYLSEIEISEKPLPEELIESVKTARTPLYREAAKLLHKYQRFARGEFTESELHTLFNTLFVGPEGIYELFELYWAYKLIDSYDSPTLNAITDNSRDIARWTENGEEYRLRYRSASSMDNPPNFYIPLRDADEELDILNREFPDGSTFTQRYGEAARLAADLKTGLLDKSRARESLWSGEPDITLSKHNPDTDELLGVFIGEVKYAESTDKGYIADRASQGLDELSRYLELVRDGDNNYLASRNEVTVRGGVFTPKFTPEKTEYRGVSLVPYDSTMERPL